MPRLLRHHTSDGAMTAMPRMTDAAKTLLTAAGRFAPPRRPVPRRASRLDSPPGTTLPTPPRRPDGRRARRERLTVEASAIADARYKYPRRRDSNSIRWERLEESEERTKGKVQELGDLCWRAMQRAAFSVRQVAGRKRA